MKEIGGYIELDSCFGQEYHSKAVAVNSGRHALEYLIRAKNIEKLYIPYFLCSTIRQTCEKCKCEFEYYSITEDFNIKFDKKLNDNEYIYIVNYYGQLSEHFIKEVNSKYKNIILDNAQAFFDMQIENIATIYTCRKFFGVSDGGYVYTDNLLNSNFETDVSYNRIEYILGRYELDAGSFYNLSVENNEFFQTEPLKNMSKLTHNLLRRLDYEYIAKRRTENFKFLHLALKDVNKLKLTIPYGPFMYPLYIENANKVKKQLIQRKIFVPTLWSDVFEVAEKDSTEWNLAEKIVPLPIDQRYDLDDMKYVLKTLRELI